MTSRLLPLIAAALVATSVHAVDKTLVKADANHWEQKANGGWGDYPAGLAIDGEVTGKSSWRGEKHEGAAPTITFEFPEPVELESVTVVFLKHFERVYMIDILGSDGKEGSEWIMLSEGAKNPGQGENETVFDFKPTKVKKLRIVGHGNSNEKFGDWTNIIEIYFNEKA